MVRIFSSCLYNGIIIISGLVEILQVQKRPYVSLYVSTQVLRNIITECNVNFSCDLSWNEENLSVWKLSVCKRSPPEGHSPNFGMKSQTPLSNSWALSYASRCLAFLPLCSRLPKTPYRGSLESRQNVKLKFLYFLYFYLKQWSVSISCRRSHVWNIFLNILIK